MDGLHRGSGLGLLRLALRREDFGHDGAGTLDAARLRVEPARQAGAVQTQAGGKNGRADVVLGSQPDWKEKV